MKIFGTILAFLSAAVVVASPCGTVFFPQQSYVQSQKVHHEYANVKKVVVLEYAFIPTYPIGVATDHVAPAVTAPQTSVASPCDAKIAALQIMIDELRKQVAGSSSTAPGSPPPGTLPATAPPEVSKKSVIRNECAACHDKAVAASKGKSVTLSDGAKVLVADAVMTGKMLKYVASGKCPPGKSLSTERFTEFLQELVDMNSK